MNWNNNNNIIKNTNGYEIEISGNRKEIKKGKI